MAFTLKQTKPKQPSFTGVKIEEIQLPQVKPIGLNDLLGQLELIMKSEDYDNDFLSPTESAAARMQKFLKEASDLLRIAFPVGTIYADGDGGLRLEWIRPDRELRLVVSALPQGRNYIYHEQGDDYAADYAPTADKLGRWLNWLEN